jgi:bisphosphoglycerate-independent phosphoglycerate mutase (AlkP superfamily)
MVGHTGNLEAAVQAVETLDECVAALRKLNDAGLHANTTLLGEAIPTKRGAAAVTEEYEQIIERLVAELWRNLGDDGVRKAAYRGG